MHRHLRKRVLNGTYRLPCLPVSTVSGCRKNTPGRASASIGHITKLEQSTLLYFNVKKTSMMGKKSAACDTHCFPAKFGSQDLFILMAAEKYSPKDVYYITEVPVGSLSSVQIT